uniref:hypothetical protein n=1 Tax=Brooklawnia sp. TaxID=2699740 RepID=UPI00311EBA8D
MTTVSVPELQRAWQALQAGHFAEPPTGPAPEWLPDRPVIPVSGVHGQCGASTVALALTTLLAPARLVECASGPTCGLTAASAKELGPCSQGWTRGLRGDVMIDRSYEIRLDANEVPMPADLDRAVDRTVVDVGWDPTHVLATRSWLSTLLLESGPAVLVAEMSVPGLRRLENTLSLLPDTTAIAAVVGPPVKRWPKQVMGSAGTLTRQLIDEDRLVSIPVVSSLRQAGLTPEP